MNVHVYTFQPKFPLSSHVLYKSSAFSIESELALFLESHFSYWSDMSNSQPWSCDLVSAYPLRGWSYHGGLYERDRQGYHLSLKSPLYITQRWLRLLVMAPYRQAHFPLDPLKIAWRFTWPPVMEIIITCSITLIA